MLLKFSLAKLSFKCKKCAMFVSLSIINISIIIHTHVQCAGRLLTPGQG